ncbi:OmpA family protein [Oscillatoria amoena NRMC-F 0135]|nr:OmpA family protein [Oscillatoria amoena NRMC-F 0135]
MFGERIVILVFLLSGYTTVSQQKIIIQEDFSSNQRGWYTYSGNGNSILVNNGRYEFDTPEGGWISYFYPAVYADKDFYAEAKFTQMNGNDSNGFGFIWGYDANSKQLNNFVISGNGYAKVWASDESRTDAREWKKIEGINGMGKTNTLRMAQQNGQLLCYVNGKEVFRMKSLPWYGKGFGFVTYTNMKMTVDDFVMSGHSKINLPDKLTTGLKKENLGQYVNTRYNEVTPNITVDGKMILFTRKHSPDNLGGTSDASDVWYSTSADGQTWSPSKNMQAPINSEKVNNITAVGQDNNTILMATGNDFELFERTVSGWKSKGTLGVYYENEHTFFEATQSADGKAILFAAKNRKSLFYQENREEKDIFVTLKNTQGRWSEPINLGAVINTRGNEASPFLAADGKTLYFSSEGHPGYGDMDIFMSRRLDDTWTTWSTPVNLGPEINSFGFDAYYTLPASGDYAYMCTNAGGFGESDIVRIKLPEVIRPDPVVLVVGKVLNAKTKKPVEAAIVFENLVTRKETGEAISNPLTGDYRVALPYGVNYGLHARAKGYLSVNENVELVDVRTYTELQKDLFLVPIEIGEAIQLNNVFFEQGRPLLKPESYPELDRLVQILKDNPTLEIDLGGHTDNVGNPNALLNLSQERVATVKSYLVKNGIHGSRITGKGYGASQPLVKNDTEEHRRMNRRVEFKITKK